MATLSFQTALRRKLGIAEFPLSSPPCTLLELLTQFEQESGLSILDELLNSDGTMPLGLMILLNGKNIRLLGGLQTIVNPDDTVIIFPPSGGG